MIGVRRVNNCRLLLTILESDLDVEGKKKLTVARCLVNVSLSFLSPLLAASEFSTRR